MTCGGWSRRATPSPSTADTLLSAIFPYLDAQKQLQWGAFVAKLEFVDKLTVKQDDHQIWFAGSVPHGLDGNPIPNLAGGPTTLALGEASKDVVVQRRFSNKPKVTGKFADFFDKIESYLTIISGTGDGTPRRQPLHVPHSRQNVRLRVQVPRHAHKQGGDNGSVSQVRERCGGRHRPRRHRCLCSGFSREDAGPGDSSLRPRFLPRP